MNMNKKNHSESGIRTASKLSGFCKSPDMKALCFLLLILSVSCCFMFRDYLFGNELMIFNDIGSDTWQQYIMNYTSIVNHLRNGNFSLWDFNNGLGINQFNFNLFDPFLMLLYGAGVVLGPAHMLLYINVIQVLKILAAGAAFYWFLSQFSFSAQAKLIASYTYALNGFLLVWGQHYQFGTVVIYFPLMLLFCEKFIQKKKGKALFSVMVFLCGIYSVYFTYMCLAATGLYLLFRPDAGRPHLERAGTEISARLCGDDHGCGNEPCRVPSDGGSSAQCFIETGKRRNRTSRFSATVLYAVFTEVLFVHAQKDVLRQPAERLWAGKRTAAVCDELL